MSDDNDTSEDNGYYYDPETGERVKVTFEVHLTMRATHDAFVEVEAYSEQEAVQLALDKDWDDMNWHFDEGDVDSIQVEEIGCEDPPAGAFFIPARLSKADISAQFEESGEVKTCEEIPSSDSAKDGDQCK